ncbi:MAG: DUF4391 domain-containing protein [Bacteroidales bacterium]|nr:DUF4391 domain-containing protein [Bacteroidales bacterium]
MYSLPQSTEIKKQLPKKAIFAKFDFKTSQKESFDEDISRIDIVGVISPETVPALAEGKEIKSLYVLAVQLKRKNYDSKNIALLTKLIPQNMVLALHYEDKVQFAIYHTKLISSNWQTSEDAKLSLSGLNLDSVWENIVKSIGDIEIEEGNTLTEQIASDDTKQKILSQISVLERKMANEKQPKRKREYFEQIKHLKNQI